MVRGENDPVCEVRCCEATADSDRQRLFRHPSTTKRFQLIWSRPPSARECPRSRHSVSDLLVLIPAAELRIRRIQTRLKWVTAKEHRNRYGQVSGREKTAGMAVGQR